MALPQRSEIGVGRMSVPQRGSAWLDAEHVYFAIDFESFDLSHALPRCGTDARPIPISDF
jgi:hypothetical protein